MTDRNPFARFSIHATYGASVPLKVLMLSDKTTAPGRRCRAIINNRKIEVLPSIHQDHIHRAAGMCKGLLGITDSDIDIFT
ncbi:MAG: hypothetical protein C4532_13550 [Candidatus Abyssobacteria bacterium SURF_17]|uniref:Uncharacterized protein n=1 Tax=Candidatus Abyssobacteria bacterium SURF_17 TaxID=2093361 RepID=A0A419EUT2_9BACT|nr:MAG: hypothetical protein C4532_13550 [Candidatus Abyssubacteria bacterium SURF_17]